MNFTSDLEKSHLVTIADHVHSMHTQAIFLTNVFKNIIVTANGKNQRPYENNNSDNDPSLSFASLTITSDASVTPKNQIAFQKSSTKNRASNYEAFEGSASLEHTLLDNVDWDQSFQKPSAMLNGTSASDNVLDRSVDIHPFYHTGYHRLFIGVSATVAQCLGLVDGSQYYSVEQMLPWVCRPFIDRKFKHTATLQSSRLWEQRIRGAIYDAQVYMQSLFLSSGPRLRPHLHRWFTFYTFIKMFGYPVKYCPHGEVQTCKNKEDVFGTFYRLCTLYERCKDGHSRLLVRFYIQSISGTAFIKDYVWTGLRQVSTGSSE
jgi:hypothetical protein